MKKGMDVQKISRDYEQLWRKWFQHNHSLGVSVVKPERCWDGNRCRHPGQVSSVQNPGR